MHVYLLVLTITRSGDIYSVFCGKPGLFIHGHYMMFFLAKINASLSNCHIACKNRVVLKMLQLFYITLAYIVYTYIKSSCWSI